MMGRSSQDQEQLFYSFDLEAVVPLTVNIVVHRANITRIIPMVDMALALGASRLEIAHVQYYGWAEKPRRTNAVAGAGPNGNARC
jgi:PqqA peptide cyclase